MTMRPCRLKDLKRYIENAVEVDPDRPVLVDKYLDRADELDVDALCDKEGNVVIAGIMQHIEQAGVHSGELSTLCQGGKLRACSHRPLGSMACQHLMVIGYADVQSGELGQAVYMFVAAQAIRGPA